MNILLTALQPSGGIRTYFRYIYGDQCFENYRFTLVAPDDGLSNFLGRVLPKERLLVEPAKAGKIAYVRQMRSLICSGNYDLVQAHGFSAGLLTAVACIGLRIPFVITTHDVFLKGRFPGFKGWLEKSLIGKLLSKASAINPVGRDAAENLASNYPALERKIFPVRNGIHVESFETSNRRRLKRELELPSDAVLLGFFGRFMGQKGFSTLRDAVETCLEDSSLRGRLAVVCFGWGGFIREEQAELTQRGLTPWFHFVDHTDDMAEALRGVDIAVMPSRWEACPLLPMEAMVSGVPVIASDCIGMKEVTEDTPALSFAVNQVDELASAIKYSVDNLQERKQRAEAFRETAARRFDAKDTAKALRTLFESTLRRECADSQPEGV
ncbi:glycosyltransferase family 4 protein [Marinobacter sp.]|uniref:glycosyltransferase family 4 protein n=1 Tax=Marinobacter sp. TaxID=50741 RepID=UPI0035C67E5E